MSKNRRHGWIAFAVATGLAIGSPPVDATSAEPAPVACSADRLAISPGASVVLRVWADPASPPDRGRVIRYDWDVRVGRLDGRGPEIRWTLGDVRPGRYAAAVRLHDGSVAMTEECVVRVLVVEDASVRGPLPTPPRAVTPSPGPSPPSILTRETGGAFLLPDQGEASGYGLYSYLLFGATPGDGARDRYRSALEAYVGLIPDIAALERYVRPAELNIAYVPVQRPPDRSTTPDRLLAEYDYARARSLLRLFPGGNREGPYIVSSLRPLGSGGQPPVLPTPYLFQDLSKVPPHLVGSWVKEFLNQAAQERFWEDRSTERFALRLRVTVGVLAAALPEVKKALDTWIAWVR